MGVEVDHLGIVSPSEGGFTTEIQTFKKDEVVPFFNSKRFYIVQEGLIAIQDEEGRCVRVARPNVPFGFENFDGESTFQGKVLTKEAVVKAIDIDMTNVDVMIGLYRLIAQADKLLERRQLFAEQGYSYERVAQALLDMSLVNAEGLAVVPLPQGIIGQVAHVRREDTSNITTRMETQGLIRKGTGKIFVKDSARLRPRVK